MKQSNLVAIGLRAKTARAIAVVLGGTADAPVVLTKTEIRLADPKIPATAQPYHEVMDLPWEDSQRLVRKYANAIEKIARKALAQIVKELRSKGMQISGVGIVGAGDRDLTRIGNSHIRAHAAEGILFRQVLDQAAESNGLEWRTFPDRQFDQIAAAELRARHMAVKQKLNDMGRLLAPPWRADEKQAATAAWLVLHRRQKYRESVISRSQIIDLRHG
jgi:hypothetical protein